MKDSQHAGEAAAVPTEPEHLTHLSVSGVVHCKICRHPRCQHSQDNGLEVDQIIGCRLGNLLQDVTGSETVISVTGSGKQMDVKTLT